MKTTMALLLMSLLAGACGPGITDRARIAGAADLKCSQVQTTIPAAFQTRVAGCGKSLVYFYQVDQQRFTTALERAAFELGCPRESLIPTAMDDGSVGITGCGKRGVYVVNPLTGVWLLNGAGDAPRTPAPATQSAAPM